MVTLPNGLRLSYVDQGDRSAPVLLLVPGPTDSWRTFEPVLPLLPARVRAIALSQRGHGDSDKPETGYLTEDFASDLGGFLDALDIEDAVIVGHSGAGLVMRRFAIDHPRRVRGIVLEASPLSVANDEKLRDFVTAKISALRDPIEHAFVRDFVGDTTGPVSRSFLELMVEESMKLPARVWRETFDGLLRVDDTTELGSIEAPALLVWGDADTLVSRSQQDALAAAIPDSRLVVYAGIGHTPHWEDPSRFAADLVAFVERTR